MGEVVKIETFLKGGTMNFKFNPAQLSRPQRNSLFKLLDVMDSENQNELEVTPVEFPIKLRVKLDDDIELLLGWDVDKQSYAGLTKPERPGPEPYRKPKPNEVAAAKIEGPDAGQKVESLIDNSLGIDLDMAGRVIGPELVKSEVGQRVEALANAFLKLAMPFDSEQRIEMWSAFCTVVFKELVK
jgi:hypothetical protein